MEQSIKVLIVDDEHYSREELKHLLSSHPSIKIVGEADSGEAAVLKAVELQPDAVFLDVEMPRMNGMQTAKALLNLKKAPFVVFATAYPEFAAEAFRYNAVDYLLKPYDEEQLADTIDRLEKVTSPLEKADFAKKTGKLAVESDSDIHYLEPHEIVYVAKDDKVTKVVAADGTYETKSSLKELEVRLVPFGFCRIHKSFLVNLKRVTRMAPWFNGAYQLEIEGCSEMLSVSRNYVKTLRTKLEI
ncbi:LytR/AlgR family response regulator transcription factor [Bacillus sp. B-jedd]|uniref:LytR/AlgR family response regulator transcription factor n=1 Tax=Bacillus sp. B-jedd TaxID=1476857 RepID=UPI000515541F|nr:LytTR family DNA-binding domain-containing protein [Bacillus sp. B-jedd]CEG26489.1 two-component response regulator [Bacillus sp. B-jedd]